MSDENKILKKRIETLEKELNQKNEKLEKTDLKLSKLSAIIEQSSASIVVTDVDGNIESVNRAFEKITGYSSDEVIGQNPRVLKTDYYDDDYYKDLWDTISSGKIWEGEFYNKKKDGSFYWEKASIAPVKDKSGKICSYVAIKEDITQKKHENELLRKAKEDALEANKSKSIYLANVSHDIRTPMNSIIGFADLLYEEEYDYKKKDKLKLIIEAGNNLISLINDILDLSKIESGRIELIKKDFSIKDLVKYYEKIFSEQVAKKGIIFSTYISNDVPDSFWGDKVRVSQILTNLISNAIKFTEKGSVRLSVNYSENKFIFTVKDTGIGIKKDNLKVIFNPFEQGDLYTSKKYGGSGLGLAITNLLVSHMGGKITVESEYDVGSSFKVVIPDEKDRDTEKCKSNLKVIIIENDPFELKLLETICKILCLNYVVKNKIDKISDNDLSKIQNLIIVDYDDCQSLESIKKLVKLSSKEIKVLLIFSDSYNIKNVMSYVDYTVKKPLKKSEFKEIIEKLNK